MARSAENLAKIGVRLSTRKLLEQAEVSERQAREGAAALGARFPAERTTRIASVRAEVAAATAERSVATGDKVSLTAAQDTAFADAKRWVRDVLDTAATAFDGDDAKLDAYFGGPKIGRSVPRLVERMRAQIARVKADADALAAEGFGPAEIARGEEILGDLVAADAAQEAAIKAAPARTREINVKKAELYLLLKALVRAARRSWRDEPARQAAFELDLLRRGGGTTAPVPSGPPAS